MGTTCYAAHNSPRTYEAEKREIESIYANAGKNEILQAAKVANVWYLAVKIGATGEVWAGVCKQAATKASGATKIWMKR